MRLDMRNLRRAWESVRTKVGSVIERAKKLVRRGAKALHIPIPEKAPIRFVKSYRALKSEAESFVANVIAEAEIVDAADTNPTGWRVAPLLADMVTLVAMDRHRLALRRAEAVTLASSTTIRSVDLEFSQFLSVERGRRVSARLKNRISVIEMIAQVNSSSQEELNAELKREFAEEEAFSAGRKQIDSLHDEILSHPAESVPVAASISQALRELLEYWATIEMRIVEGSQAVHAANGLSAFYRSHLGLPVLMS